MTQGKSTATKSTPVTARVKATAAKKKIAKHDAIVITESMSPEDVIILQSPLIERMSTCMTRQNLNQGELAKIIGTTPSFITSMFNGLRWVPRSDRRIIESLAEYLQVPLIQIFIWSGFFGPKDLVIKNELPERLKVAYQMMSNDPMVRHMIPPQLEWDQWESKIQLRFVMLYEITAAKALLEYAKFEFPESDLKNVEWILARSNTN